MTSTNTPIARGDVWEIRFNPSEGDEIRKIRPAVVMSGGVGRMNLRIVVPITAWKPHFNRYQWMYRLSPTATNGLAKDSVADGFQVRSLSVIRFQRKLGVLAPDDVEEIAAAIALCIEYQP